LTFLTVQLRFMNRQYQILLSINGTKHIIYYYYYYYILNINRGR
jgi:hypothetical protein